MTTYFVKTFGNYLYGDNLAFATEVVSTRQRTSTRANKAGKYSAGGLRDSVRLNVEGTVVADNPDDPNSIRTAWGQLKSAHEPGVARKLYIDSDRYLLAEVIGDIEGGKSKGQGYREWTATLCAFDEPYWYSDQSTGPIAVGSGAAAYSYTDLVVNATNSSVVTSALRPFTAADVNCTLVITGGTGFTTKTVYVVSVDGSHNATLSDSVGVVNSTGGTGSFVPSSSVSITTAGDGPFARPVITIVLSATSVGGSQSSIACFTDSTGNLMVLDFGMGAGTYVVDCDQQTFTFNGSDILSNYAYFDGEFIELLSGVVNGSSNTIKASFSSNTTITSVNLSYQERWS